MPVFSLRVNGTDHTVDVPAEMPLLWVVRDVLGLTGTKFGCGVGQCSACTVHVAGMAMQSCRLTIGDVAGEEITTIEGLSADGTHPVQNAWVAEEVPQCGYCQPGYVMRAAAVLADGGDAERIEGALGAHICRCGTYDAMRRAIAGAAEEAGR